MFLLLPAYEREKVSFWPIERFSWNESVRRIGDVFLHKEDVPSSSGTFPDPYETVSDERAM